MVACDAGSLLHTEEKLQVPPITWRPKKGEAVSTQVAFGHIMFELAKVRAPSLPPMRLPRSLGPRLSRMPEDTRPLLADILCRIVFRAKPERHFVVAAG